MVEMLRHYAAGQVALYLCQRLLTIQLLSWLHARLLLVYCMQISVLHQGVVRYMTQQLLISLDYELFFGSRAGTVEKCMIEPTNAILDVIQRHGMKLSLFVDAGFLICMQKNTRKYPQIVSDMEKIQQQLRMLKNAGHDVQLHIHPHWEDSYYDGSGWRVDTTRYKLHDFSEQEIARIVNRYKAELVNIVGDTVFAYRAGGWCLQPFDKLAKLLKEEGIWLDSTVFAGGKSNDLLRWFDFSIAPEKSWWKFNKDPVMEDENGCFVEVPISSCRVTPLLFWRMLAIKKLMKGQHQALGDGGAMKANWQYYFRLLTSSSHSVVSIDGLKSSMLQKAWNRHKQSGSSNIFNIMGHPKSVTRYSLSKLDQFLTNTPDLQAITYQDLKYLKPS